jgi:hypothetical protein
MYMTFQKVNLAKLTQKKNSISCDVEVQMAQPPAPSIREVLLLEIVANDPKGRTGFPNLQQGYVLDAVARKLQTNQNPDFEQAILTQWNELFRTGIIGWGLNIALRLMVT